MAAFARPKKTARKNPFLANRVASATYTIGLEGSNIINVSVQLKDEKLRAVAVRAGVFAYLSDDAAGDSIVATAPSSGWAIGTNGVLIPVVANKAAQLVTEATGIVDVNITEAGVKTVYLVLVMPDGGLVVSGAITWA